MRNCTHSLFAAILLAAAGVADHCIAAESPAKADADQYRIQTLAAQLPTRMMDRELAKGAANLKREGNRSYRQRHYRAAQRFYRDAYPNVPEPYSFVMAADSQLRAMVLWNISASSDASQCMRESTLRRDVTSQLTEVYSVGLGVAEAANDRKFMSTTIYRRAKASEACLWQLVRGPAAKDTCADFSALSACLGNPLIR